VKHAKKSAALDVDLPHFLDASPSPYHAAAVAVGIAVRAGFQVLYDGDPWALEAGRAYVVLHNGSTVAAFRMGRRAPADAGFRLVGAHTDSPNLRLKPRPGLASVGHVLFDVEVYGSPILATWLDRDLSVAGRVTLARGDALATALVRVDEPVCRISSLAIHLSRGVNEDGLKLDKHRHLSPSLGLLAPDEDASRAALDALARAAECQPEDLRGFDVGLYDTAKAAHVGRQGEFLASARLDNLASCHAALAALVAAPPSDATAVALLFDHEEVGSQTAEGASSAWTAGLLTRIATAAGGASTLPQALARSLLVSADMAHAVHPNHPEKHDGVHAPRLNGGPVVKTNASRRYGTDAETGAYFRALCRAEGVVPQEFVTRADLACGSTIGPIVAAGAGIRTVDVGNPMLSMHSVRELCGRHDAAAMTRVLTRLFAADVPLPW
jgi:aspartyl aminopeptidase